MAKPDVADGVVSLRLVFAALLGLCFCGSAAAEGWQEYVYGDYEFAVSFPQVPTVQSGSFQLPGGPNVPARIYSVTAADGDYRVTVADFSNRPESQSTIIDAAEKMLKQHGEVKVELPARVQAVFGRQLSLNERDGSHISAALFVFQHRLYQITGTSAPAAALAGSSDAIRFQQSLRFTGNTVGFFGLNFLFGALRQLVLKKQMRSSMFGIPQTGLVPNTPAFENEPLIAETGFREYDARWLYPQEINLVGIQALGLALGTFFHECGVEPKVVVGHDYRSYSLTVKQALMLGLMAAGCEVHDIGLALSPVAYFAQFALDVPCVAMVTASHNENGWTGVKMGAHRPLTFGPEEMLRLKQIALSGAALERSGGRYIRVRNMRETYLDDVTRGHRLARPIKVVAACGNGTAGAFAPEALHRIGAEVVPMDANLDWNFPRYNPNPEDLHMLHAMAEMVRAEGAEIALGFDGDGDRCGVVDGRGRELFADKVGVLVARHFSERIPGAKFVVDVKSTGLFETDPVLKANGAMADYWKTGHSYIKQRTAEIGAVAGLEKSGHYFFNLPFGRGYDDSIVSAIAILEMVTSTNRTIAELADGLPRTWSSPTMSPFCPDLRKYDVVDALTKTYTDLKARGEKVLGQKITRLVTINGVRVTLEDGTWGLVRASSNRPSLVVVCESPVSEKAMHAMFHDIDARLKHFPEVGEYDQKI